MWNKNFLMMCGVALIALFSNFAEASENYCNSIQYIASTHGCPVASVTDLLIASAYIIGVSILFRIFLTIIKKTKKNKEHNKQ